jgi:hypothetical protein
LLAFDVISTTAQIGGFDGTGVADLFPSKAKQMTMYQWILIPLVQAFVIQNEFNFFGSSLTNRKEREP